MPATAQATTPAAGALAPKVGSRGVDGGGAKEADNTAAAREETVGPFFLATWQPVDISSCSQIQSCAFSRVLKIVAGVEYRLEKPKCLHLCR